MYAINTKGVKETAESRAVIRSITPERTQMADQRCRRNLM